MHRTFIILHIFDQNVRDVEIVKVELASIRPTKYMQRVSRLRINTSG